MNRLIAILVVATLSACAAPEETIGKAIRAVITINADR